MSLTVPGMARPFLLFCAPGLIPNALSYGAMPSASLDKLFGITVDNSNLTHILRAVMGLYLGMVFIWLIGAFRAALSGPALVCCAVFMLGLAFGRVFSFVLDGQPHWLLILYAVLEIVLGVIAVYLYIKPRAAGSWLEAANIHWQECVAGDIPVYIPGLLRRAGTRQ